MTHNKHLPLSLRQHRGFSLIELSLVLIVVALILGAVTVGTDVLRNASYQRLNSSFVRGWQLAYLSFKTKNNFVLGDSVAPYTGYVGGNTTGADGADICTTTLRTAMLAAGVEMPQGRTEGKETQYSYQDSNGNPQELEVCFRAIPWMTETAVPGTYNTPVKNVMVIKRVTPDLARMIDSLVDTSRDAQFGKIRQFPGPFSVLVNPPALEYSLNNTCVQTTLACGTAYDEAQVATMTLYYLMD